MAYWIRPYRGTKSFEVDIKVRMPDGTLYRERKKSPVIQRLAGHKSLQTTLRYLHLAVGETDRAIALLERGEAVSEGRVKTW